MFNTPYSRDKKFYFTLISNPLIQEINLLSENDNIIILNPDYIVSIYHIFLGVNKACYNLSTKKGKSKILKSEVIYCLTNETKLDMSLKLHSIANNKDNNYYLIFINMNQVDIDKIIEKLKGNVISSSNYSKFINEDKLKKAFQVKQEELDSLEDGLISAVYNRISTKDLK